MGSYSSMSVHWGEGGIKLPFVFCYSLLYKCITLQVLCNLIYVKYTCKKLSDIGMYSIIVEQQRGTKYESTKP